MADIYVTGGEKNACIMIEVLFCIPTSYSTCYQQGLWTNKLGEYKFSNEIMIPEDVSGQVMWNSPNI